MHVDQSWIRIEFALLTAAMILAGEATRHGELICVRNGCLYEPRRQLSDAVRRCREQRRNRLSTTARVIVTDANNGTVRQDISICGDSDDIFLDKKRHRMYVSCGSGDMDVLRTSSGAGMSHG